jgi:cytochrome c556
MAPWHPFFLLTAACAVLGTPAQVKPETAIHYRQSVMRLMGWNFTPLAAMVKGQIPFDAEEFTTRAERLQGLAGQILEGFPPGSDKGAETDAKAEIWTDFPHFKDRLDDYAAEAGKLVEAAHSGNEARIKEQFRKTAATCKACHDKYKDD